MTDETRLTIRADDQAAALAQAGRAANEAAARHKFDDYRSRKAANTIRRQDADLALFARYLAEFGVKAGDLAGDPGAWRGITWGLVEGFVKWQLSEGYSVGSVNVRLSTIRTYAKLAMLTGAMDTEQAALIRAVQGYSHKESKRRPDDKHQPRGPPSPSNQGRANGSLGFPLWPTSERSQPVGCMRWFGGRFSLNHFASSLAGRRWCLDSYFLPTNSPYPAY